MTKKNEVREQYYLILEAIALIPFIFSESSKPRAEYTVPELPSVEMMSSVATDQYAIYG